MAYEDLKALIDHLDHSSLSYLQYESGDQQIILSKEVPTFTNSKAAANPEAVDPSETMSSDQAGTEADSLSLLEEVEGETVDSPMVGVAYLQAQPGSDPYVQVGDSVKEGQVVMIIEAMKLMNEIQADRSGVVTEILVSNEEVVEYGQPLIRIN